MLEINGQHCIDTVSLYYIDRKLSSSSACSSKLVINILINSECFSIICLNEWRILSAVSVLFWWPGFPMCFSTFSSLSAAVLWCLHHWAPSSPGSARVKLASHCQSVMSKFSFLPVEGNETLCGRTAVSLCSKARIMTAVLLEGSHLVFAVCWSSLRLSLLRDSGALVNLTWGRSRAPITANAPIIEARSLNSIVERTRLADSKVIVRNSTAERELDWEEHSDSVKRWNTPRNCYPPHLATSKTTQTNFHFSSRDKWSLLYQKYQMILSGLQHKTVVSYNISGFPHLNIRCYYLIHFL